jgi:hypothetical protein
MNEPLSAVLKDAPSQWVDAQGRPRFGTFAGSFSHIDLSQLRGVFRPKWWRTLTTHKKWLYLLVVHEDLALTMAVVDLRYASNAFCQVVDLNSGAVLLDESRMGTPLTRVKVADSPCERLLAAFSQRDFALQAQANSEEVALTIKVRTPAKDALEAQLSFALPPVAQRLAVVAPVGVDGVNCTQKLSGMTVSGQLQLGSRALTIHHALAAYDFTSGLLKRQTDWRWAFGLGRLLDGRLLSFNLVEGINDEVDNANQGASANENVLWLGERLIPVGRATFAFSQDALMQRWTVKTSCGRLNLEFEPKALHREAHDFKLVASDFAQPVGLWSGVFRGERETVEFRRIAGVAESQRVKW